MRDRPKPAPPPVPLPDEATFRWSQDNDTCDSNDLGQVLSVEVVDSGAGKFLVLKTERWALDGGEIDRLVGMLRWALAQCKAE